MNKEAFHSLPRGHVLGTSLLEPMLSGQNCWKEQQEQSDAVGQIFKNTEKIPMCVKKNNQSKYFCINVWVRISVCFTAFLL